MMVLWVAIGGALGAATRYIVGGWIQTLLQNRPSAFFPWGTLLINVTGCAVMGLLMPVFDRSATSPALRVAVLVGVLGGYTTWSSFGNEALRFLNDGDFRHALYYVVGTNAGCLVAVWLGYHLMERLLTATRMK